MACEQVFPLRSLCTSRFLSVGKHENIRDHKSRREGKRRHNNKKRLVALITLVSLTRPWRTSVWGRVKRGWAALWQKARAGEGGREARADEASLRHWPEMIMMAMGRGKREGERNGWIEEGGGTEEEECTQGSKVQRSLCQTVRLRYAACAGTCSDRGGEGTLSL